MFLHEKYESIVLFASNWKGSRDLSEIGKRYVINADSARIFGPARLGLNCPIVQIPKTKISGPNVRKTLTQQKISLKRPENWENDLNDD